MTDNDYVAELRSYGGRVTNEAADRIEALTEQLEEAYARGFCAGQRALKDAGELVIIDSPEIRDRIEALTTQLAEDADVRTQIDHRLEELVGQVDALTADNAGLRAIVSELRRRLGGGCDANHGGDHLVIKQGTYAFCGNCGESLRGERFCHVPRAASTLESKPND